MIYNSLKVLVKLTTYAYFKRIKIDGIENIPQKGPYIFVANHPSAFMDPVVIAGAIKPALYFIAAGEYVGKGLKGWIFKKMLHMIPVYRPDTRPGETFKNNEMFEHCYTHLNKQGALLIFPEGVSVTDRILKPLKTGVIRIARGAELKNLGSQPIPIVPIGLNYSNPHEFRSDLLMKIGEPYFINKVFKREDITEKEKVVQATNELEKLMQDTLIHTVNDEVDAMWKKLDLTFLRDLKQEQDIKFYDQLKEFELKQFFVSAIQYFRDNNLSKYNDASAKLESYLLNLDRAGLNDKNIAEFNREMNYKKILSFALGLPFFLLGAIFNFIPYNTVIFLSRKIKMNTTFKGSITLAIGLFTFLGWYIALTIIIGYLYFSWFAIICPVLFYATGIYSLMYLAAIRHSASRNNLRKLFSKNSTSVKNLIFERKELIELLKASKEEFEQANTNQLL